MSRFKSRIAANSAIAYRDVGKGREQDAEALARFSAQKLDILGARYEFMNRSEVP